MTRPALRLLPDVPEIGWTPYAWLVYLPFQFVALVAGGGNRTDWTITLCGMAAFLLLYFRSYWECGSRLFAYALAMAVLGAIVSPDNPAASTYFVYAAACGASYGVATVAWRFLGVLLAAVGIDAWAAHLPPQAWIPALVFSALVGALRIRSCEMEAANASLRLARDEVERLAKVAERERIARDLHDVLGHSLSVIVLKAELASRLAERDVPRAVAEIADVERIARASLGEVREAIAGYRASGILAELARARGVLETAGLDVACELGEIDLPPRHEGVLTLAIREAVTEYRAPRRCIGVHAFARAERARMPLRNCRRRSRWPERRRGRPLGHARARGVARGHARARRRAGHAADPDPAATRRAVIRVVLAEDQGLVRGALAALLELEGDIAVVAQASDGDDALACVRREHPDVLVTDIEMPRRSGLDVAAVVRDAHPSTRVVIVTTFARAGFLRRALDAGVAGYLLKDAPARELADAVRRVAAGGRAIDPQLALDSWSEHDPLTDREREVLRLSAEGLSAGAIGRRLGLSDGTVRNYLSEAGGKLGAANRIEAARIARDKGWL